jgi:hypothetical protein
METYLKDRIAEYNGYIKICHWTTNDLMTLYNNKHKNFTINSLDNCVEQTFLHLLEKLLLQLEIKECWKDKNHLGMLLPNG